MKAGTGVTGPFAQPGVTLNLSWNLLNPTSNPAYYQWVQHAAPLAGVAPTEADYNFTVQTIQLAANVNSYQLMTFVWVYYGPESLADRDFWVRIQLFKNGTVLSTLETKILDTVPLGWCNAGGYEL
jgi:hypothetical protein